MDQGKLYLYRGLPGSGKSTRAGNNFDLDFIFEADDYFNVKDTVGDSAGYWFDPDRLHDAHRYCLWRTKQALNRGYNVAVANTFTQIWEMKPYLAMTPSVFVYHCTGNFKSLHNVPDSVIHRMKLRFEAYPGEIFL